MSLYLDAFAHDIFPTVKDLKAYAMAKRPVLALLQEVKHEGVGKTYGYPALVQAAIAQGTSRAAVQEQQSQANDIANFDGEEFALGYFPPGYKNGFEISEFDMALTDGAGGVPSGAYLENFSLKMRGVVQEFGQRQERYFVGKSGKSLAQTTANGGTTNFGTGTVQLADPLQIGAFRHAQILNASLQDASTPAAASLLGVGQGQKIYIRGIDVDNGVLFVSDTSGGVLGHAAMNAAAGANAVFLFNLSDFQGTGGGNVPNVMPPGLQDWIPATWNSSLGNFFGVVRGRDSRFAGWRLPTTGVNSIAGLQIDGVIKKGLERAFHLFGDDGDSEYTVLIDPTRWTQLEAVCTARGYRMLNGQTAIVGYRYIEIQHAQMSAKIIAVPAMSKNDIFFLKMNEDGWQVRHLNGWPRVLKGDGLQLLRAAAEDKYEFRMASFFHYGVRSINQQGRGDITLLAA